MTRVAIAQSNYIPWRGYFDLIDSVDHFVLLDTVQYTCNDWRNRNRLKTPERTEWLTIPIATSGRFKQRICDAEVADPSWSRRHWDRIDQVYRRATRYRQQRDHVASLYHRAPRRWLSDINCHFIEGICRWLGIATTIHQSAEFPQTDGRTDRLLDMCRRLGATEYVSGPSARSYLDESLFLSEGIAVSYFDYEGFVPYPQLGETFEGAVSIIDAIFNVGDGASRVALRPRARAITKGAQPR